MKPGKLALNTLTATSLLLASSGPASAAPATDTLQSIQTQWAKCQYDVFNKDNKIRCLETLIEQNQQALKQAPTRSELKVWLAINKSSLAGVDGGLGALSLVKEAKALLEEVIEKNQKYLMGLPLPAWVHYTIRCRAGRLASVMMTRPKKCSKGPWPSIPTASTPIIFMATFWPGTDARLKLSPT